MREFEKFLWSFCLLSCSACESDWFATWPAFLPLILQCILIWFCSFPALLSDALRIAREFECNTLRVREDRQDVTIWGISAISNELLLLADSKNRAVKELHVPSGRVELVYSEHEPGWRVCNVRARCDAVGEFFVLLELNVNQTRLSVVRKRAGKYCDATHFALEKLSDLHVCSSFMIRILPLCSSMISSRCVVFLAILHFHLVRDYRVHIATRHSSCLRMFQESLLAFIQRGERSFRARTTSIACTIQKDGGGPLERTGTRLHHTLRCASRFVYLITRYLLNSRATQ